MLDSEGSIFVETKRAYNDDFVPAVNYETKHFPEIGDLELTDVPSPGYANYLVERREQLNLTLTEVAQQAGIQLRQYQRFESGERKLASATLRIALAVCDVLRLDPHRFV